MSQRFHRVGASVLLAAALLAQEPAAPTFDAKFDAKFDSSAKLVLVPFHVERGKYFAADLQPSDFILREDGHPHPFTIFEGPHTEHPLPLELILLFDTTPGVPESENHRLSALWNPKADYEFLDNWDEALTREVLQRYGMDIRIAVYHYSLNQLERLCAASGDPREIVHAFQALLDPIREGKGELTLLPGFQVDKPLFGPNRWGWLNESIAGTLKDAAASPVPARRLLLVFTTGAGGTSSSKSTISSIVDPSLALNIPIVPVIMDFSKGLGKILAMGPVGGTTSSDGVVTGALDKVGLVRSTASYANLGWFTSMGEKTGGEAFIPPHLDREALAGILGLVRDTAISQYVVGFAPDAAAKPKKHSLAVALSSKSKGKLLGGEKNGVVY